MLTEQHRQKSGADHIESDPLLSVLDEIRSGDISPRSRSLLDARNILVETEDHTELFTRNIAVDAYNQEKLNQVGGDIFLFEMQSKGAAPLVESLKK